MNVNIPVHSELKSKRIKWLTDEPQNPINWAYIKAMRENNKTKKIYPVNPYVEVYQFRDNFYGLYSENADGGGDQWMWLTVGPERAFLVDTAFGIGDLKGLVNEITGNKPLTVACTHPSYDHSFGNCQFGEVYFHEYAVPTMKRLHRPEMWDYLFDKDGKGIYLEFDRNDIIPFKEYKITGVPNGHLFDLGGGYQIELIWLPGHMSGHAAFLDKQNRLLISGDDVGLDIQAGRGGKPADPYGQYSTITALHKEMKKLVDRLDEFDHLFPGHGVVDIESHFLINIFKTLEEILRDPEGYSYQEKFSFSTGNSWNLLHRSIHKLCSVCYTKEGI